MQKLNTNHIFLNASAGSGKTFALCIRYIALLFQDVQAHEILTLTFTKKAANEMKERITQNLFLLYITQDSKQYEAAQLYDTNSKHYTHLLQMRHNIITALQEYNISQSIIEYKTTQVYRQFLQADKKISTIDSFFTAILRKFAFFIGIRRDFDLQEKQLYDDIFECFLAKIYKNPNLCNILHTLIRDLNLNIESHYNNTLTLKNLLATLYDKSIEFQETNGFLTAMQPHYTLQRVRDFVATLIQQNYNTHETHTANQHNNLKKPTPYYDILNYLDSIIQTQETQLDPTYIATQITLYAEYLSDFLACLIPQETPKKRVQAICEKLASKQVEDILTHTLIIKKEHNYIKQDIKPNIHIQQEITDICTHIHNLGILYFMCLENALLSYLYLLMDIYTQSVAEIESKCNILSFQSVAHKVFAITTDTLQHNTQFQSDYFYFRLDSTISHILFDEYQDTSIIQYRIFLPIFQEILAGSGTKDSKSLFFVGDSKQSLYAFRGANPCVFETTRTLDSIQQQSLQHNYRSKKAIIDFINDKFSLLYGEHYIQQLYSEQAQDTEGVVCVRLFDDEDQTLAMHAIFVDALAQITTLIESHVPKKEIAILARKRDTLHTFALFVKEQKSPILFNLDKNGKLIHQPSIQAIFYAFKTHYYREQIDTLEIALAQNTQPQDTEQNRDLTHYVTIQSQEYTTSLSTQDSYIESLQTALKTARNHYKFAQKKLNKLLGKSYFDNQYIYIPKKQSLAQTIKSVIESCRLYNQDCMELLEIASQNIQIKTIDELFLFIADKDSIVMQEEAIHAMSVHGSKGLGFQHVIYLDYEIQNHNTTDKIFYDYNDIFLQHIRIDTTKSQTKHYQDNTLQQLIQKKYLENIQQEHNNLYVACTRAKIGLYIFAHAQSSIAQTLKLQMQEDYGIPITPINTQNTQIYNHNPIIINALPIIKGKQEEFLQEDTPSFYHHNIAMHHKKMIGLGLHYCLELMLGYGIKKPQAMLHATYGFYLHDTHIAQILQRAENIFYSQLEKLLCSHENTIKCEISFLKENNIKRLDAIVQHHDRFSVIEFKSSQEVSEALLQEHTAQLQSYMESIATILQTTKQIQGYLVYLQDNIVVKEVTLHIS